jgi:hypothetical protein
MALINVLDENIQKILLCVIITFLIVRISILERYRFTLAHLIYQMRYRLINQLGYSDNFLINCFGDIGMMII